VTGCWSIYISHVKSVYITFGLYLWEYYVPENHRSVSTEEDFSAAESSAFVGERVGSILLVYGNRDSRVRKNLRQRHHGRILSLESWRLWRLELPSPSSGDRFVLGPPDSKSHRINRVVR